MMFDKEEKNHIPKAKGSLIPVLQRVSRDTTESKNNEQNQKNKNISTNGIGSNECRSTRSLDKYKKINTVPKYQRPTISSRRRTIDKHRLITTLQLLTLYIFSVGWITVNGQILDIGPAIDEESCYEDLIMADEDGNGRINKKDYLIFLTIQNDIFEFADTFDELPSSFKNEYTKFACSCTDCIDTCDDSFYVGGIYQDDVPNDQTIFLYQVCAKTYTEVNKFVELSRNSKTPTTSPTPSPTFTPTRAGFTGTLDIDFELFVMNEGGYGSEEIRNKDGNTIYDVMVQSIGIMTEDILEEKYGASNRKLLVSAANDKLPMIGYVVDRLCPEEDALGMAKSDTSACVDIKSTITIFLQYENYDIVASDFTLYMQEYIVSKQLQNNANALNKEIVYVNLRSSIGRNQAFVGIEDNLGGEIPLGAGELVGIGVAGFTVGFALIAVMFVQGRKRRAHGKVDDEHSVYEDDLSPNSKKKSRPTLGAPHPHYHRGDRSSKYSKSAMNNSYSVSDDGGSISEQSSFNSSIASSSYAGSSGWSSGGVSSLNTGSVDSMDYDRAPASSLAAIGIASGMTSRLKPPTNDNHFMSGRNVSNEDNAFGSESLPRGAIGHEGNVPNLPYASRTDLDDAIQAGDWAAVGATAALLATAASDTISISTRSYSSKKSSSDSDRIAKGFTSFEAARTAELDHLVDTGDWEGVVLAAAKFETSSDRGSHDGSSRSFSTDSRNGFRTSFTDTRSRSTAGSINTFGTSSGYSFHASKSVNSEALSRAKKRDEIRSEVEALVRRVVPEEINNVDEMLLQFRGREEELLETLRTMQERSIAQRARVAIHKSVKREARNNARRSNNDEQFASQGLPPRSKGPSPISYYPAVGGGVPRGAESNRGTFKRSKDGSVASSVGSNGSRSKASSVGTGSVDRKKKSALDRAIEAGDWEAVGEAAAMMSDTDGSTVSGSLVDQLANRSSSGGSSIASSLDSSYGETAVRANQLDKLIEKGDWEQVVNVAGRFTKDGGKNDRKRNTNSSPTRADYKQETRRNKRTAGGTSVISPSSNPTKEEKEALAQANLWMAIAAQSKQDGKATEGASDAADWAISRSLSALRNADKNTSNVSNLRQNSMGSSSKDDKSV